MDSTISILSYNSTGMDCVKVKWINELLDVLKIDLCCIQEHFKAIQTVNQYFNVKAAIREDDNAAAGRPRGGLAQFVNLCKSFKKERIMVRNWRLQAQVIHVNDSYKLLFVNVYFPNDPQTQSMDETELLSTLEDLEDIIENSTFDDALFAGDWNWDESRNTRFVRIVQEFMRRMELVSVWSKYDVKYTYEHNVGVGFSTIDHFFTTPRFLEENVVDAGAVTLPDNLSNHSPIMIKIKLPEAVRKVEDKPVITVKPNWKKAEDEDIENYSEMLTDMLSDLPLPASISCSDVLCEDVSHEHDRDAHTIEVLSRVIEASFECIPVAENNGNKKKPRLLPGWRENVEPVKRESLFWHGVWLSYGRPTTGSLYTMMRWTRANYRYAVRAAKKEANRLEAGTLAAAAEANNKELFMEMRRHIGNKKKGSGQQFPDSLEGKVTKPDIINTFRSCYEKLYNTVDSSAELGVVKTNIQTSIKSNIQASLNEANKITPEVVRSAAELLKPDKSDVSQLFSSDVFKHAPQILYDHIAAIFRSYVVHGSITKEILVCSFLPLIKGPLKDPRKLDSYRAIAGASQLLKLLEYTILILWGDKFSTDSMQYGFKSKMSTGKASWLILEVANHINRRGGMVFGGCLDLSKAFDYTLWDKLFLKILKKGVPPIVVKVLIYSYQEQRGWGRLQDINSNTFRLNNGVRQGSVASPFAFGVYLDSLLKRLREQKLGCHIQGVWMGACCYADDIFLLAPNRYTLQRMLAVCEEFGAEHNMRFSTDPDPAKSKSTAIIFRGGRRGKKPAPVLLDGKPLPCGSFMRRAADIRDQLHFSWPGTKMKALQLLAQDAYGSNLWLLDSNSAEMFFRSWNTEAKLCWGLDRATHINLIEQYFCSDMLSLRRQVLARYPNFVRKLLDSPSFEIRFLANIALNDARSPTCRNLQYLNEITSLNVLSEPKWKVKLALPFQSKDKPEPWRISLLTTLLECRFSGNYGNLNSDKATVNDMIKSLCIS